MKIIPAIDLIEGQCVRLTQGSFSSVKVYSENPLDLALQFEAMGIKYLHVVDLDGVRFRKIVNWKVLETLAQKTGLTIDFGGGLYTNEDIEIAFNCGAEQVTGGSVAVKNPDLFATWIEKYGSNRMILGADVYKGNIAISGWQQKVALTLDEHVSTYHDKGIRKVICTAIDRDGMLNGPDVQLYKHLLDTFPNLELIASGGVQGVSDLESLKKTGVSGVIIGKALYEERITLKQLQSYVS